jgi:UDP-glucose:(heptosyl)LPS alpha-1,3-glucosyltransferase
MRLAVIRQRYTPFGGAERFLENALQALLERKVTVTLYTREWNASSPHGIEPRIVDPFHVGGLWRDASFARAVCDGVHAAWLDERLRHLTWLRGFGIRINPHHRYRLAAERRLYASARLRAVICNSQMVKTDIRTRFNVPDERLRVIYNAVDTHTFTPDLRAHRARIRARHRIPARAMVYLHVGSGFERKGVAASIDALAALPAPAHLIVVGKDKHVARYADRARRLGLSGRVTLAGPQPDPRPYFGAADAFVLPTLYDPCPNAALEAMACSLPIVTSTRSGAAELALAHDAGLVCEPGDADQLATHMHTLQDGAIRARMGANGRTAMLPLTSVAMTSQLVALYSELMAERRDDAG